MNACLRTMLAALLALLAAPACGDSGGTDPGPRTTAIRFEVTVPEGTPASATVMVKGDRAPLTGSDGLGFRLDPRGGRLHAGEADLEAGESYAFTIRLLDPPAAEVDAGLRPVTSRSVTAGDAGATISIDVAGWGYDVGPTEPGVTFLIGVPASTPAGAVVGVSGNHAKLGAWNGKGVEAVLRPDGRHEVSVAFTAGTALEYKVTRGSWDTVEKGPEGQEIPNRRHTVAGADTVEITVAAWRDQIGERPHTLTGDIRTHRGVTSAFLAKPRDVIVYLPPGYAGDAGRRYPVLYMHDGQNLFDEATSFIGIEWGVDETAESLIAAGDVESLIVVGVYNTADRIHEYTPVARSEGDGGGADAYGRFLVEELKPFIDATYRTKPDAAETGLAGSSLGGLVTMYLGLEYPEVFTRLGVVSPAVWWADSHIVGYVGGSAKTASRVWVDIGTGEGGEAVAGARALRDALVARGWVLGADLRYVEAAGAPHNEAAWAARMGDILRFLYPRR